MTESMDMNGDAKGIGSTAENNGRSAEGGLPFGVARLILRMGDRERSYEMNGNVITVGRIPNNDIPISFDKKASRNHAKVEKRGDEFYIVDLQSKNGTFTNGKAVHGETKIASGDVLTIGETDMRFEVGDMATAYNGTMLLDQAEAKKMFSALPAYEEENFVKREEPAWISMTFWGAVGAIVLVIVWVIMQL